MVSRSWSSCSSPSTWLATLVCYRSCERTFNRYSDRVADLQPYQRVKCAKLVRSSVYDAIAFACGVLLLWQCRALYDLCHKYTKFHEYVFSFALT